GIKTFSFRTDNTFEKIAEFNKDSVLLRKSKDEEIIKEIARLRNERIKTTERIFGLENMIYHCVARRKGGMLIYELSMDLVNLGKIHNLDLDGNIIDFKDDKNDYKYNISKSTLYKKFTADKIILDFDVKILKDPFSELDKISTEIRELVFSPIRRQEHIFLPLYSYEKGIKKVYEKSGLNQWNASGRPRDLGEVYIPIPAWIHDAYPSFFPSKDVKFMLKLPNGSKLKVSLCQQGSKALMSDPNKDLGEWLLRYVLGLKEGEILTYSKLEELNLDSVVIYKNSGGVYSIDFTKIDSFENFKNNIDTTDNPS
ncbi:MAG: NgoFVII family restriction endonuclease, partial [Candidatus Levybacteria bacterium]|nr:NgoFVII family restriction endonuclease [Candidatus Levybacteria bacterium]